MGARPSMAVVPTSAVSVDVQCLTKMFPEKFVAEKCADTKNIVLFDKSGQQSLTFLACSPAAVARSVHRIVFVVDEAEILTAEKRNEFFSLKTSVEIKNSEFVTANIFLPGGSIILAVSPAILDSAIGRQTLAAVLSDTLNSDVDEEPQLPNGHHSTDVSSTSQSSEGDPTDGSHELPNFPSLDVSVLGKNGEFRSNFPINSHAGVPIESDLFVGKLLLLLRPSDPEDDPYWNERIFSRKKRRIIFQIQGKFKYQPRGVVYAGAEVSEQMKLGLMTRGMATILLNLVKKFNKTVHYSFGDDKGLEKPHIVVPAFNVFERFIVTPPGETPPPLGEPFIETKESIEARKAASAEPQWNTMDTYSMSFYSMYIDIPTWTIVSLPLTSDINLKNFWGNSLLRIIMYESTENEQEKRHLESDNKYAFIVKIKHSDTTTKTKENDNQVDKPNETMSLVEDIPRMNRLTSFNENPMRRSESQIFLSSDDEESQFYYDATERLDDFSANDSFSFNESAFSINDSIQDSVVVIPYHELIGSINKLCPAWIDICESRGRYRRVYCFNVKQGTETLLRTSHFCKHLLGSRVGGDESTKDCFSPRLSHAELMRRSLGRVFGKALGSKSTEKLQQFESTITEYDKLFLRRQEPSFGKKGSVSQKTGFVARAISDHHWIEEWADLSAAHISFYHPDKKKPRYRVNLHNVIKVHLLEANEKPCFPRHFFLAVESLGRTIYLMFVSKGEANEWFKAIKQGMNDANMIEVEGSPSEQCFDQCSPSGLIHVDDPSDEFLHKSSMWDCKSRRILNCRQFSFETNASTCETNALLLVEDALSKALHPMSKKTEFGLKEFLNSAAKLKSAEVHCLNEEERLTFFLNLYHVMVMHAFLVLGVPASSFQWISYFNCISYQCSGDIFSLAELEHCIIRAKMSMPSQFISRFVLPKSKYLFALSQPDVRINFALNCGSYSNPKFVPIFRTHTLNAQLDAVSRAYLNSTAAVEKRGSHDFLITLPKICQWFSDDFGSNTETVKIIEPFLTREKLNLLQSHIKESGKLNVSLKYLPYSFECRHLTLEPERST